MKKLAIIAFAAFASSAFATGSGSDPQIDIKGDSVQTVSATFSTFKNYATGAGTPASIFGPGTSGAYALQNVSSNSGNVEVGMWGDSHQHTMATSSYVKNFANGTGAYAAQSISSNLGNVNIAGDSTQITKLYGSVVWNQADNGTKAIQNLASNNACVACK